MRTFFSKIMGYWAAMGHIIGAIMTPVHMFIVYVLVFGPARLIMGLLGKDPLEKKLRTEPTFWRKKEAHEPSLDNLRHTF